MKRARLVVPVLTLGFVLAIAPSSVLAKKKHKKNKGLGPVVAVTATGNTVSTEGQESRATATCPSGKQAVGGGFSAPVVLGSALFVHDSYRSAPGTWTVAGQLADGAGAVTAHAYCRNASKNPITDVSESAALNTTYEAKTLAPSCPAGTRLIGGGFQSTVPPAMDAVVIPEVNQATSPISWTVTGVANQDGPRTLTAHAYCMARISAPAIVSQASSATVGRLDVVSSTSPSCPVPKKPKKKGRKRKKRPKKQLSAGGFSSAVFVPLSSAAVFGESRIGPAGGWFASATNATTYTGTLPVTSQAICF